MINEDILTQKTLSESLPEYGMVQRKETIDSRLQRTCWKAFWVNIGLASFKILVGSLEKTTGAMGYSQLLIIDGLTSAAIASIISMVIFGIHMSRPRTINEQFPYGMGKAQYITSLLVGAILAICAAIILGLALKTFFYPMVLELVGLGLSTALISIFANILLIRYIQLKHDRNNKELQTIIRLQSVSMIASLIVGNSLLMTGLLGWFFMERVGSLSISILVVVLSFRIIKQSLDGIMDRSCGQETESKFADVIQSVDGVQEVQCVRTRHAGQTLCVDIRLSVHGDYTIRQTDHIESEVRKRISKEFSRVNHVITLDCFPA
ncbi:MAG: cation diffusion facilitator family transporter [Candidatus Magnetomorum sp.]|nr:cation diffusion facilitator family transporter [Candidatus Magnetomorum sp.]